MHLRILPVCLLFVLLTVTSALSAEDHGQYIGAQLGAVFAEENDAGLITDIDFKTGVGGAVSYGYDAGWRYGHSRAELELGYRISEADSGKLQTLNVTDGEVSALSLMLNLFYPFETGHQLTPYIMGGLGAASLDVDNVTVNGTRFIDDSEIVFAYQVGTGIELAINRSLSLDLAYRYFGTADKEFENDTLDAATKHFDFRYETHNALLGLRYKF